MSKFTGHRRKQEFNVADRGAAIYESKYYRKRIVI